MPRLLSLAIAGAMIATLLVASPAAAKPKLAILPPESFVTLVRADRPRLLLDNDGLADLTQLISTKPAAADLRDTLVADAEALLGEPTTAYDFPDGRSLLLPARAILNRTYILALAYRLTGDVTFADRAFAELEAAAAFPDWNPESFLSTAELLHAFGIGYDWLHSALTTTERTVLENAIVELGFEPALAAYANGATWTTTTNNWALVATGGISMAAFALADRQPALSEQLLQLGFERVQRAIGEYGADGAYPEGPNYWDYATRYLGIYLAGLDTALGDDFGLSDLPGLSSTVDFSMHMASATGRPFNYYDGTPPTGGPAVSYWFAKRFDRPEYAWWGDRGLGRFESPPHLMWYALSERKTPIEADLPRDIVFDSVGTAVSRSAWNARTAISTGFRAGNAGNHGDLDMGTFILDGIGTRWATELGADSYGLPGYFDQTPNGQRWNYYRKRAEGQNTLVVNPGAGPDQVVGGSGEIVAHGGSAHGSFAVADLDEAYADRGVESWRRGVALIDDRTRVVVQDELVATSPAEAWWFMHTPAEVEIAADGRSAVLTIDGRQLLARFAEAPDEARFSVMAPEPLATSPDPDGQGVNQGSKLTVHLSGVTDLRLAVVFDPIVIDDPTPLPAVEPLSSWNVVPDSGPRLSDLTVNGVSVDGFHPDSLSYFAAVGSTTVPQVAATGANVTIDQPAAVPGIATICVGTGCATRYRVFFGPTYQGALTGSIQGTNPTSFAIDGDLATFWSANGSGNWLQANLDGEQSVSGVRLAWSNGASRVYDFEVWASPNGEDWTTVFDGQSSGTSNDLETSSFDAVPARHIRVVTHGNSQNTWMSLAEFRVITASGEWPPTQQIAPIPVALSLAGAVPISMYPRQTRPLDPEVTLSDESTIVPAASHLQLRSSDSSIVSVNNYELVAQGVGTAVISGVYRAPSGRLVTATLEVTVEDPGSSQIKAARDTYVRGGSFADDNYGRNTSLLVKRDPTSFEYARHAFVAFNLDSAAGRTLESAELVLTAGVGEGRTMAVDVLAAGTDWSETGLTWPGRPPTTDVVAEFTAGATAEEIRLDITDHLLTAWDGSAATFAFGLVQDSADPQALPTTIWSRERPSGGPRIELNWAAR